MNRIIIRIAAERSWKPHCTDWIDTCFKLFVRLECGGSAVKTVGRLGRWVCTYRLLSTRPARRALLFFYCRQFVDAVTGLFTAQPTRCNLQYYRLPISTDEATSSRRQRGPSGVQSRPWRRSASPTPGAGAAAVSDGTGESTGVVRRVNTERRGVDRLNLVLSQVQVADMFSHFFVEDFHQESV